MKDIERLEEQWRKLAERPPETEAGTAARRVVMRLAPHPRRVARAAPWLKLAAIAAAVAGLLALGIGTLDPDPVPLASNHAAAVREVAVPPLDSNVVLLWLDVDTPLYMTFDRPASAG